MRYTPLGTSAELADIARLANQLQTVNWLSFLPAARRLKRHICEISRPIEMVWACVKAGADDPAVIDELQKQSGPTPN